MNRFTISLILVHGLLLHQGHVFKGVIFPSWGSPYETADHYWPMSNVSKRGNVWVLEDINGAAHTHVYGGGKIRKVFQLGYALQLDGHDDWVDTGGFNKDCVTNPVSCYDGFTITFWLKSSKSGYIMSSGSFTDNKDGPGFRLTYKKKIERYEFVVETKRRKWVLYIHGQKSTWIHMAFLWQRHHGLMYYENGNLSTFNRKPITQDSGRRNPPPVITLARPYELLRAKHFGRLEISQFAIWMQLLTPSNIWEVYERSVKHDQEADICCYFKSVSKCYSNPCNKTACQVARKKHRCICPQVKLRECKEKPSNGTECRDRSSSCNLYAQQDGYCQRKELKKLCPRACALCGLSTTHAHNPVTKPHPPVVTSHSRDHDITTRDLTMRTHKIETGGRTTPNTRKETTERSSVAQTTTTSKPAASKKEVTTSRKVITSKLSTLATKRTIKQPLSDTVGPTSVSTQSDGGIPTSKGSTPAGDGETNPGPCTDRTHFHDRRAPNAQVITSRSIMNNTNSTMREMRRGISCDVLKCLYYARCVTRDDEGFAECECPLKCNLRYEPVCGDNGKSYENKCALKLESCITEKWIKVEKRGTCEPPYQNAAHYWPLNNFTESKTLLDLRGHCKTLTYNDVRMSFADQLGHVISLDGKDDWIRATGVRNKCIKDPTHCSEGLSVAFWINYSKGEYILSCGRYTEDSNGPGFRFFFSKRERHFVLQLATQNKRWEIILDFLPRDIWFHVSITWDRQHGLKFYRNGDLIVMNTKPKNVKYTPLKNPEGTLTLGRPNSLFKLHSYGNFSIGHLVIWTNKLTQYEVRVAYESVLYKTRRSFLCCHSRAVDPCVTNPCHNGATCRKLGDKFKCVCPEQSTGGRCGDPKPILECKNNFPKCLVLASQTGYCKSNRRYMERECPKACKFCSGESSNVRQSTLASRIFLVTSTPVKSVDGRTVATLKPSLKATLPNANELSQPHVATRTNEAASVHKSKDSGPSTSSESGAGAIRIISKTKDFYLQTNYATRLKNSGSKDSDQKGKEASNTIKVNPALYKSSANSQQDLKSRDSYVKVYEKLSSSNRVSRTSAVPERTSTRSIISSAASSAGAGIDSSLHSDVGIKSSPSLPSLFPSPEVHVTRTSRTATLALQPTPSHLYPSHEQSKPSVLSSFPMSVHEVITSPSKVAYDEPLPLSSAPTGPDITNKSPPTRPLTNSLTQTAVPPVPPTTARPLSCGGGTGEACVCYNCHAINKSREKCCTKAISSKRLKQGIVMEIADISVGKFIMLEDTTIQAISRIITRECKIGRDCGLPEVTDALNRFRREVIKSSPQIQAVKHLGKHQELARMKSDQKRRIKRVVRPSRNSIRRLLSSTAGPATSQGNDSFSAKVVFFSISATDPNARSIEAAMYSTVTSGANTTRVVGSGKLLTILNGNKAALENKLNITIRSFKEWKEDGATAPSSPSPTDVSSSTPPADVPGAKAKIDDNGQKMSRKSFVIAVSAGAGGFLLLLLLFIFLLTRCTRKWKGEFVPDRAYPDTQQNDSTSMISSFVDPSVPRITDVPHKPKLTSNNMKNGVKPGSKKAKKPAGVKVTYKPPKWD